MSTKVKSVFEFRRLLNQRLLGANPQVKRGLRSKILVLNFFIKNGHWPSKLGKAKRERVLGARFENYVAKTTVSYDPEFRKLAMSTGRTTNNKRGHNVKKFKEEIVSFIEEHGRVPVTHREFELVEGESKLRSRMDYYTKECNDMTLLGTIYTLDPCHLSGIPSKFRAIINSHLDVEKPLIRLV